MENEIKKDPEDVVLRFKKRNIKILLQGLRCL